MSVTNKMSLKPSITRHGLVDDLALALAVSLSAALLAGCGSTKEKTKPEPRVVLATFEGQSVDQVRTALMVACTQEKWTIRSKTGEVSCHNNKLESRRYDVIERMVNDPVGQRYSENIQFEIAEDGTTVRANGRAWVQYVVPGGFFTSATIKTMDLEDDPAIEQIRKILKNAKGKVN